MRSDDKISIILLDREREKLLEEYEQELERLKQARRISSPQKRILRYKIGVVQQKISKIELRAVTGSRTEISYSYELESRKIAMEASAARVEEIEMEYAFILTSEGNNSLALVETKHNLRKAKIRNLACKRSFAQWEGKRYAIEEISLSRSTQHRRKQAQEIRNSPAAQEQFSSTGISHNISLDEKQNTILEAALNFQNLTQEEKDDIAKRDRYKEQSSTKSGLDLFEKMFAEQQQTTIDGDEGGTYRPINDSNELNMNDVLDQPFEL